LHGDVLMWLMKTLLTSGCTNQRGAGHSVLTDRGFLLFNQLKRKLSWKITFVARPAIQLAFVNVISGKRPELLLVAYQAH
ncbi:hypothetical protein CI706_03860, partial [Klebsiella pneumoniae subsp. pneumoniae]